MVTVTLTTEELDWCWEIAARRHDESSKKKFRNANGLDKREMSIDYLGTRGECSTAKAMNRYWGGHVNHGKGFDVCMWQVRSSSQRSLIIRPDDEGIFIFAKELTEDTFVIMGWIDSKDAKVPGYFTSKGTNRPPAYFVPGDELNDMASLKAWLAVTND